LRSAAGRWRGRAGYLVWWSRAERELFEIRFREERSLEEAARRMRASELRVKQGEKVLRKRLFHAMEALGYFEGFRWAHTRVENEVGVSDAHGREK
ncbi:MAG: hypothetical protein ACM35F_02320, partial [Betaproteobacteria bacterium]